MFQTTKAPIDANLSNGKDGTPEESPSNIFVELEVVFQSNTIFNDRIFPLFILSCILEAIIVIDPPFEKIVDCCKILCISSLAFNVLLTSLLNSEEFFSLFVFILLVFFFFTFKNLVHNLIVVVTLTDALLKVVLFPQLFCLFFLNKVLNVD